MLPRAWLITLGIAGMYGVSYDCSTAIQKCDVRPTRIMRYELTSALYGLYGTRYLGYMLMVCVPMFIAEYAGVI